MTQEADIGPPQLDAGLLGMRLMLLMRAIREGGLPLFEAEVGYKEIHRHLLLLLGLSGGMTSQDIVGFAGYEKAQVSRAIKPLERDGLIVREKLRAKLTLSPAGRVLFEKIRAIVRARDGQLVGGLGRDELERFGLLTDQLAQKAARIYNQERCLSVEAGIIGAAPGGAGTPSWPVGPEGKKIEPPPDLIAPKLVGLVAYLKRSAMLSCQRMHGLSNFQGQVLALIGLYAPLPMAQLIKAMGRDKSQIGRTVSALEESGLIERFRPTRRRDIVLQPTEAGAVVYKALHREASVRDASLWSEASAEDRAFYQAIVSRLMLRARALSGENSAAA
ncbi:DNA-binding MarR family transcriptional regulator [Sphingobium sp. B1D7B]|uniref:MarR family transcriptional regulator n=1 Tax=unclassified Sphingobium TaxID=2611147 RepID=UPI0022255C8D|nr:MULTISPECIES: MarR family transcriptional regulator [unclassified Sphingobium]MCW2390442.1 DNA-binding MarR family transcriptional regulator [Sphingobium sp. B11D3A]MCW2405583.1 DNA-binding MarR family transcriptional regulator [Sphingobium sp. B1D7B]